VTKQEALRRGFTREKVFKVTLLNSNGEKLREWEIIQYYKRPLNLCVDGEVNYLVTNKKGFFSGYTRDGIWVSVTCECSSILIVEAFPIQEIENQAE